MAVNEASRAADRLVVEGMRARAPAERAQFLRELVVHAAAGLTILEGDEAASEAVYRVGDAVVGRGKP